MKKVTNIRPVLPQLFWVSFRKRMSKRMSKLETNLPKPSQSNHGNYSLSSLIPWRECVGVEPTQEREAVLATVLKFGTRSLYSYKHIRHNFTSISLLPSAKQIQTLVHNVRTATHAIKKGCQKGCQIVFPMAFDGGGSLVSFVDRRGVGLGGFSFVRWYTRDGLILFRKLPRPLLVTLPGVTGNAL